MSTDIAPDDELLLTRFPRTAIDRDAKEFYRGWLSRKLLMNRCRECAHWHHPPRPICPKCLSEQLTPTEVSGDGTVHLLTRMYQGMSVEGVSYDPPYPVVVVELVEQEGLRFTGTVIGCPPDEVHIGQQVALTWISRESEPYPVFRPR
jgi:uncharacterized OB-fold protein